MRVSFSALAFLAMYVSSASAAATPTPTTLTTEARLQGDHLLAPLDVLCIQNPPQPAIEHRGPQYMYMGCQSCLRKFVDQGGKFIVCGDHCSLKEALLYEPGLLDASSQSAGSSAVSPIVESLSGKLITFPPTSRPTLSSHVIPATHLRPRPYDQKGDVKFDSDHHKTAKDSSMFADCHRCWATASPDTRLDDCEAYCAAMG